MINLHNNRFYYYLSGLHKELFCKDIFLCAQAIAFKGLVTLVPALVVITGLLGQILRYDEAFATISTFAGNLMPPEEAEFFVRFLRRLVAASHAVTVVGIVALLLSLISLLTSLRVAVYRMFIGVERQPRAMLAGYLFDLRMLLQLGLLMLLTFGLSSLLHTLDHSGLQWLFALELFKYWLPETIPTHTHLIAVIVAFICTALVLAQLYFFVPRPRPPIKSVIVGALIATILWELAKYGFTLYAINVGHFHRYDGVVRDLVTLAEVFGLILAYVFWVYFSGLILCLGALITLLHEQRPSA